MSQVEHEEDEKQRELVSDLEEQSRLITASHAEEQENPPPEEPGEEESEVGS